MNLAEAKTIDVLRNRSSCMNRVHDFANIVVPSLINDLIRNGFKVTNDYQLYKKDKDRLQAVLDNAGRRGQLSQGHEGRRGSSAYLRSNNYSIWLEVSDSYPERYHEHGSGSYSCEYYKRTIRLWSHTDNKAIDFEEEKLVEYEDMVAAKERLAQIEKEMSDLQSEKYPLKRLLGR